MPMLVCGCRVKGSCLTGMAIAQHYHNLNRTIRFLTKLNENFSMVKSQILLMDPLPNINRIFSMVIQHERQYLSNDDAKILANSPAYKRSQGRAKGSYSSNYSGRNSGKVCSHCGKDGHIVDTYYKIHGYPPNWPKSSSNLASGASTESYEERINEDCKVAAPTITQEHYDKLLILLQNSTMAQQSTPTGQVNLVTQYGNPSFEKPSTGT